MRGYFLLKISNKLIEFGIVSKKIQLNNSHLERFNIVCTCFPMERHIHAGKQGRIKFCSSSILWWICQNKYCWMRSVFSFFIYFLLRSKWKKWSKWLMSRVFIENIRFECRKYLPLRNSPKSNELSGIILPKILFMKWS